MAENFGSAIVELRVDTSKLKSDMDKVKSDVQKGGKEIENNFKNVKLDLSTTQIDKAFKQIQKSGNETLKTWKDFHNMADMQGSSARWAEYKKSVVEANGGIKTSLDKSKDAIKSFGQITQTEIPQSTNTIVNGFKSMVTAIVGFLGIRMVINLVKELTMEAAKFEEISSFFKGSAADMGLFRAAVKGTVSDMGLMRLSNQANDLGVSLKEQPLLFAMAKRAAEAYGTDTETGFQRVIMATEGNIRGLRAVGVQKKVYEQIVKDLAKAHGGLINEMDAETQKEIRMQAIIKATGMTIEGATTGLKSYEDRIVSVAAKWENLKITLGKGLTPFFAALADAMGGYVSAIERAVGKLSVLGGAERESSFTNNLKNFNYDPKTKKSSEITQDQLNKEKDANIELIKSYKELKETKEKASEDLSTAEFPNKDKIKKYAEEVATLKVQLYNANEQQKILANYKIGEKEKEDLGGGLTPEALLARADKEKGAIDAELKAKSDGISSNQKLDAQILLNLESMLSQLGNEYEKKRGVINQAYQKELSDAQIQRDKLIRDADNELKTGRGDTHIKAKVDSDKARAVTEYNNIVLEADRKLNIETVALKEEETNKKLAFDQRYLTITQQLEKDKFDQAIRDYSLSVSDYEAYLNKMLVLKIQKLEEENKVIEKNNKEHPDNVKSLIDITEQRTIGTTEIKNQTQDYKTNKENKWDLSSTVIDKTTGQLRLMTREELKTQRGMEQLASTISSGLVQGIAAGERFIDILGNMILKIGETVAEAAVLAGIMSLLNPSSPLGFLGFFGKALGMSGGGSFIVPGSGTRDNFPILAAPGELVNITPANQVNNYSNSNVDMSGVIKQIQILDANQRETANRQKTNKILLETSIKNDAIYLSNKKAAKQRSRFTGAV